MLQAPVWLLPAKSINSIKEKTKPIQAQVILGKTIPKKRIFQKKNLDCPFVKKYLN